MAMVFLAVTFVVGKMMRSVHKKPKPKFSHGANICHANDLITAWQYGYIKVL